MTYLVAGLIFVVVMFVLVLVDRADTRRMKRDIEEFMRMFPGTCPVCAFYRFGYMHGFECTPKAPSHPNCPERKRGELWTQRR